MIHSDVTKTNMHKIMNYDKVSAELATLRAERDEWKSASRSQGNIIMLMQGYMGDMRAENERLREALEPFAKAHDGRRRSDIMGSVCFKQGALKSAKDAQK